MNDLQRLMKQLALWIQEAPEGKKARAVKVFHLSVDENIAAPVFERPIKGDENVADLAREIYSTTKEEADSLGESMKYACRVYYDAELKVIGGRCAWKIVGEAQGATDDTGLGEFNEGPTDKGREAQRMRHLENVQKIAHGTTVTNIQGLRTLLNLAYEELERLRADNKRLMDGRESMIVQHERLLSQENERQLAQYRTMRAEKMKEAIFQKVMLLLPFVVNKIANKKLMPEGSVDATKELVRELLASISDSQAMQIMGAMNEDQQKAFSDIYRFFGQQEIESEKKRLAEEQKALATIRQPQNMEMIRNAGINSDGGG